MALGAVRRVAVVLALSAGLALVAAAVLLPAGLAGAATSPTPEPTATATAEPSPSPTPTVTVTAEPADAWTPGGVQAISLGVALLVFLGGATFTRSFAQGARS